jgi:oligoribonuclease NrnB/cAMP/cGMP phosphodiesterase (DHH superfamily)
VDLRFPEETHELLKQFPPAPENTAPKAEWLTDYQKQLAKDNNIKISPKQQKLIPHLHEHKRYVIDYRNLEYLVGLGVEIAEVHTIVSYSQSRWLKPYIDFNTEMRKKAKNEFEKDFFKLMNNSVFGKTMENVRNRMKMHLTTDDANAEKWFSKPTFKNCNNIFGIYMIEMYQDEVVLDKPIYVGTTILDLSKLLMMRFHYGVIEKHFNGKYRLLYSDTDSFVYQIWTEDIYKWQLGNKDLFDLSDSLRDDMKDNTNKKVLGKMKDELQALPMIEFISLNPKVYSYICQAKVDNEIVEKNVKKLKGVSKAVVKNQITHEDYNTVLTTGGSIKRDIVAIRSSETSTLHNQAKQGRPDGILR